MARPFPLQTVREVLQRRAEVAAGALRDHAARMREAEGRLRQLEGFLEEYRRQQRQALADGMTAGSAADFRAFVARIEEAVGAQRAEVKRQQALWEAAREHWSGQSRREKAMDTLAARHQLGEARRDARLEQKHIDELAARTAPSDEG